MRYSSVLKSTTQQMIHLVWPRYAGRIRQGLARGMRSPDALGLPGLPRRRTGEELLLESLEWRNLIIYDIGAHVGGFTMFFAARSAPRGKVYSFEPAPQNYERLLANLRTNRLHNVRAFQVGIGGGSSRRRMHQQGEDSGTFVLEPLEREVEIALSDGGEEAGEGPLQGECQAPVHQRALGPRLVTEGSAGGNEKPAGRSAEGGLQRTVADAKRCAAPLGIATEGTVRVEALDELVPRLQLPWPNFIKIDVEGMELEALEGMHQLLRACRPRLFVEMHGADENGKLRNAEQVTAFLLRHDYSIVHVESGRPVTAGQAGIAVRGHLYCTPRAPQAEEMRWAA